MNPFKTKYQFVALWCVVSIFACGPIEGDDTAPDIAQVTQDIRIANSLRSFDLLFNALTANPVAVAVMSSKPLSTAMYAAVSGAPELNIQLHDPSARVVMKYIAECALKSTDVVEWKDPFDGVAYKFTGSLALCPKWAFDAPDAACLERVSACVLARNNVEGKRVELSMRGEYAENPSAFKLEAKVPTNVYKPFTESRVSSTYSCFWSVSGSNRNCGYRPDFAGRCTPGTQVTVGAGGRPPLSCGSAPVGATWSGRSVLRVCSGLSACDVADGRRLAESQGSCGSTFPAVTFTCPANGTFTAMVGAYNSSQTTSATVATLAPARLPAREEVVFNLREGAFFGTIFDAKKLAEGVNVYVDKSGKVVRPSATVKGSVYRGMFACHAPEWSTGAAYLTKRLCAVGSDQCAAVATGSCTAVVFKDGTRRCNLEDGPLVVGDGDFGLCRSPDGILWKSPVTTDLNCACDVVGSRNAEVCKHKQALSIQ